MPTAHICISRAPALTHLGSAEGREQGTARPQPVVPRIRCKCSYSAWRAASRALARSARWPEWFYKGDGSSIVAPGAAIASPDFALDGSEEPEMPVSTSSTATADRDVSAIARQMSSPITSASEPNTCGSRIRNRPQRSDPETLTGELPPDDAAPASCARGERCGRCLSSPAKRTCRTRWSNLSATTSSTALFRRPGDVHVHFFGPQTLSFAAGIQVRAGDVIEIEAQPFGLATRNPVTRWTQPLQVPCRSGFSPDSMIVPRSADGLREALILGR